VNKNPERIARLEALAVAAADRLEKLERLSVSVNTLADKMEEIKTRFEQDETAIAKLTGRVTAIEAQKTEDDKDMRFALQGHFDHNVRIVKLEERGLCRRIWKLLRRAQ
jgi:hypothetical protein